MVGPNEYTMLAGAGEIPFAMEGAVMLACKGDLIALVRNFRKARELSAKCRQVSQTVSKTGKNVIWSPTHFRIKISGPSST